MNLFGQSNAGDGSNLLVRNIAIACAIVLFGALVVASSLDHAGKTGTLDKIAKWGSGTDYSKRLAAMPRSSESESRLIGIRYGNVDYTPTASIAGRKPRFKNTIADPSLGMPN